MMRYVRRKICKAGALVLLCPHVLCAAHAAEYIAGEETVPMTVEDAEGPMKKAFLIEAPESSAFPGLKKRRDIDTTSPPDQRRENYDELDGRASWFYEAVTNNLAMHGMETGRGQVYMTSCKDTDDEFLDGGTNYTLHIPPKAPARLFWSLTLYEVDGRDIIHNEYKVTDRSSRMDLLTNLDGLVDLYFGPDEPKGKKQNWKPTEPGRAFFAMLRFYSPGTTLLDRSWVLPDIEKA